MVVENILNSPGRHEIRRHNVWLGFQLVNISLNVPTFLQLFRQLWTVVGKLCSSQL